MDLEILIQEGIQAQRRGREEREERIHCFKVWCSVILAFLATLSLSLIVVLLTLRTETNLRRFSQNFGIIPATQHWYLLSGF